MVTLFLSPSAGAEAPAGGRPTAEFPLWNAKAPGAKGDDPAKDVPTLTPFWPGEGVKPTGAVMVICPGGGYGSLAQHEGKDYALWLTGQGISCFVLKYRLGSSGYHHPVMMYDVQRALRTVRANAEAWQLDPARVGVMGSSAGGHLASTAVTHFDAGDPNAADPIDRVSSRPDLGVLCYPVITMGPLTHPGSLHNLLGQHPDAKLVELLSNEKQVTAQTPPCFIWHTTEDQTVPVENSLMFAAALQKNKVPFDLHIYQKGPHGMGVGVRPYDPQTSATLLPWTNDLLFWLHVQKFL